MLVVTDTSPINYLILIGYVDVLPVLHGDIIIPQAVAVELMNPRPLKSSGNGSPLLPNGVPSRVPETSILLLPIWGTVSAKLLRSVENSTRTRS
jgi:hypothetical protein